MSIYEQLEALKRWHEQQNSPSAKLFRPPLKTEQIQALSEAFPFALPKDVVALYRWHDGMKDNAPLFREYTLYPLEDALDEYELALEVAADDEDKPWQKGWFPFAGFMGEHLALDCDPDSELAGKIIYQTEGQGYPWYDGLEPFLLTVRTCFEQGAYFYDEDEILSEDWEQANAIRQQINPGSARLEIQRPEPIDQQLDEREDGSKRLTTWYSEDDYSEQFFDAQNRKLGLCEYGGGELLRRDTWNYLSDDEVEITSENMMGIMMVTKTRAQISEDGQLTQTHVQGFLNDELLYEQNLLEDDDEDEVEALDVSGEVPGA